MNLSLLGQGFDPSHVAQIQTMLGRRSGVFIVTGGKDARSAALGGVLHAFLEPLTHQASLLTLDAGPNTDWDDFTAKAREAVRSAAPEFIGVEAVGHPRMARLVFALGQNGSRVWAGVKSVSAQGALADLDDLGIDYRVRYDDAVVGGVVCVDQVRALCPHCAFGLDEATRRGLVSPALERVLRAAAPHRLDQVRFARDTGCGDCLRGHKGSTVVAECVVPDATYMRRLREGDTDMALDYWLAALDGQTMLEHGLGKVFAGRVDPRDLESALGALDGLAPGRAERLFGSGAAPQPRPLW